MHFFNLFTPARTEIVRKKSIDAALCGRSMVEMLGVLAIIGVLSVGAIAGYSKAMMKYKLNKQTEQLSTLFNAAAIYSKQFSFNNSISNNNLTRTFIKLGLVPVEMIKGNNSNYVYDVFNNQISIVKSGKIKGEGGVNSTPDIMAVDIMYDNKENQNDIAMCRNVIIAAKENAEIFYRLATYSRKEGSESPANHTIYSGYATCNEFKCIRDLTLTEIDKMCRGFEYPQIVIRVSFK